MWAQAINSLLGLWLMVAPGIVNFGNKAVDNDHIIGPVITTFAVVSLWECTRATRLYNIPLGAWLLLAPWVLGYADTFAIVNDMTVGGLVIMFSFVKGKIEKRYGGGWSAIWQSDTLHAREAQEAKER